jgi:hypothetical protein
VFIKDWNFNTGMKFKGYNVGGLSALAYNPKDQTLLALSDDRGSRGAPRFFIWQMSFDGQIDLKLKDVRVLKNEKGNEFAKRTIDPEGMALLDEDLILISSEGEQESRPYLPPRFLLFNSKGKWLKDIALPSLFWDVERLGSYGVRTNLAFEGLSVDPSKRWVYAATEAALAQDGPVPDFNNGSVVRFIEFDREGNELIPTAHLPYKTEPIPTVKGSSGPVVGTLGISSLAVLGQRRLLVLERSYLVTHNRNINRVFFADCLKATDVIEVEALDGQSFETCRKSLVLEFDSILERLTSGATRIDNLEGMVLWQEPISGKHYVLFVADNNFNPLQSTQFLLFELQGWKFEP